MARPALPSALPPRPTRAAALTRVLLWTFAGRALVAGGVLKVLVLLLRAAGLDGRVASLLDPIGGLAILAGGGTFLYRVIAIARRRLLWRVRRKLILSYIFIGVVPALLIVAFFLVSGLLLFLNAGSYLVQSGLRNLTDQAEFQARTAALEIQRLPSADLARGVIDRKQANLTPRFPGASIAVVPASGRACDVPPAPPLRGTPAAVQTGPWPHLDPPTSVPEWIGCDGFSGVISWTAPSDIAADARIVAAQPNAAGRLREGANETERSHLVIRAAAFPEAAAPTFAVVVDLPVNDTVADRVYAATGIRLEQSSVSLRVGEKGEKNPPPLIGRPITPATAAIAGISRAQSTAAVQSPFNWVSFITFTDWMTGEQGQSSARIGLSIGDVYDRLLRGASGGNVRQFLLVIVILIATLFLIIEVVALVMGLALARSITGSVHALFVGTERVRHGDFSHKITIDAQDQLGELATSFNSMTSSIEELLRQAAEKKRLEEELRIAREIQMSLLPQGPILAPGLAVTALCVPAREVGGDYYDFFPLEEHRLGVLIADVSGKGTSAALYMAELKGLMLSLSELYPSPRELLIHANRIIAHNLDARSFITMTYAVIDRRARGSAPRAARRAAAGG